MEMVKCGNSLGQRLIEPKSQDTYDIDQEDLEEEEEEEDEDEEDSSAYGPSSKLQRRANASKARWNGKMGMAEVLVQKGKFWRNTGVVRSGKLYYSIEEALFMVEKGALLLVDDTSDDTILSLEDIYTNISGGKIRSMEEVRAYKELKSLGYIVGRHGIPWSVKSNCEPQETGSVIGLFKEMHIGEARAVFDVYPVNSNFRKSSPGDPIFVLCFTNGVPPSREELGALEGQCGGVPLKFCNVEPGRVSFFSFDKIELPVLP